MLWGNTARVHRRSGATQLGDISALGQHSWGISAFWGNAAGGHKCSGGDTAGDITVLGQHSWGYQRSGVSKLGDISVLGATQLGGISVLGATQLGDIGVIGATQLGFISALGQHSWGICVSGIIPTDSHCHFKAAGDDDQM